MTIDEVKKNYSQFSPIIDQLLGLKKHEIVVAVWIEGSIAQGYGDNLSDLDIGVAVDIDISEGLKLAEEQLGKYINLETAVDMSFLSKGDASELLHRSYFLVNDTVNTLDLNIQKSNRIVELVRGVDDYVLLFDKNNSSIKTRPKANISLQMTDVKIDLLKYYKHEKNIIRKELERDHWLEAVSYYLLLLDSIVKFKRAKENLADRLQYGLKHIYRDLPRGFVERLEYYYDFDRNNLLDKVEEIENWIKDAQEV